MGIRRVFVKFPPHERMDEEIECDDIPSLSDIELHAHWYYGWGGETAESVRIVHEIPV